MTDDLAEDYPVAAPYIQKAVESMGEDWVIENYYPKISQLGLVMKIPEVEELPFYDEEKHSVMTKEERIQLAEAMSEYRENLRTGTKPNEE
jgi:hypothetical protein